MIHNHDLDPTKYNPRTHSCDVLCDITVYVGAVWIAVWALTKWATM